MKIFDWIGLCNSGANCQGCTHFQNDPYFIEDAYPGLTAFSSGFASVRDKDGFCDHHQLYLSKDDHCSNFASCNPELKESGDAVLW